MNLNIKATKWSLAGLSFLVMFWATSVFSHATDKIPKGLVPALGRLYAEYYIFVNGFIAFGLLSGVLAFIILFMQLGAASSNPVARSYILFEMGMVGLTTALLGGFPLIIVLYLNMFN